MTVCTESQKAHGLLRRVSEHESVRVDWGRMSALLSGVDDDATDFRYLVGVCLELAERVCHSDPAAAVDLAAVAAGVLTSARERDDLWPAKDAFDSNGLLLAKRVYASGRHAETLALVGILSDVDTAFARS